MYNLLSSFVCLLALASVALGQTEVSVDYQEYRKVQDECKSLFRVADLVGQWRRFHRGYNMWTREPIWHTVKLENRDAIAKVLAEGYEPTESLKFLHKKKNFNQSLEEKFTKPCSTLTKLQGDWLSLVQADISEMTYDWLVDLCKKLSLEDEIKEIYKEFKQELKIRYEFPIKSRSMS